MLVGAGDKGETGVKSQGVSDTWAPGGALGWGGWPQGGKRRNRQ